MAGSVNKVILLGRLGQDPEVRNLQDGTKVVNLSVATSERWKDKQTGENKEKTEWSKVVIWNERLGDVAERFLKKGSQVYLEGSLQTSKWTGQDGQEKYKTEVVLQRFRGELTLLDSRGEGSGQEKNFADPYAPTGKPLGSPQNPREVVDDLDSDVPF